MGTAAAVAFSLLVVLESVAIRSTANNIQIANAAGPSPAANCVVVYNLNGEDLTRAVVVPQTQSVLVRTPANTRGDIVNCYNTGNATNRRYAGLYGCFFPAGRHGVNNYCVTVLADQPGSGSFDCAAGPCAEIAPHPSHGSH